MKKKTCPRKLIHRHEKLWAVARGMLFDLGLWRIDATIQQCSLEWASRRERVTAEQLARHYVSELGYWFENLCVEAKVSNVPKSIEFLDDAQAVDTEKGKSARRRRPARAAAARGKAR